MPLVFLVAMAGPSVRAMPTTAHVAPQSRAHVSPVDLAELPQQLLRPLVEHRRQHDAHSRPPDRRARPSRRDGTPRSRSRNRCPDWRARRHPQPHAAVEGRDLDPRARAPPRGPPPAPPGAGRRPRAGSSGCGATCTVTYRSPGAARPARPRGPCPRRASARRRPRPAGIRTGRPRLRASTPPPAQAGQAACRCRPVPPQRPHVFANTMCPRAERIAPVPRHAGHVASAIAHRPRAAARRGTTSAAPAITVRSHAAHRLLELTDRRHVEIGARPAAAAPRARSVSWITSANRSPNVEAGVPPTDSTEKSNPSNPNVAAAPSATAPAPARRSPAPPLGVGQRLVRLDDGPEAHGGRAITRVDVRVEPARQAPVGSLDFVERRRRATRPGVRRGP